MFLKWPLLFFWCFVFRHFVIFQFFCNWSKNEIPQTFPRPFSFLLLVIAQLDPLPQYIFKHSFLLHFWNYLENLTKFPQKSKVPIRHFVSCSFIDSLTFGILFLVRFLTLSLLAFQFSTQQLWHFIFWHFVIWQIIPAPEFHSLFITLKSCFINFKT